MKRPSSAPKGQQQSSPGQSEPASAGERRPGSPIGNGEALKGQGFQGVSFADLVVSQWPRGLRFCNPSAGEVFSLDHDEFSGDA